MAKNKKNTKTRKKSNNIETIDSEVICREIRIQMTNEKLKNTLIDTYELAREDASKKEFEDFWDVFLSTASSLLLALLTSDFKNIGQIPAEMVGFIVWIIFILSILLLIISLWQKLSKQNNGFSIERDNVIKKVMEDIIKNNV